LLGKEDYIVCQHPQAACLQSNELKVKIRILRTGEESLANSPLLMLPIVVPGPVGSENTIQCWVTTNQLTQWYNAILQVSLSGPGLGEGSAKLLRKMRNVQ